MLTRMLLRVVDPPVSIDGPDHRRADQGQCPRFHHTMPDEAILVPNVDNLQAGQPADVVRLSSGSGVEGGSVEQEFMTGRVVGRGRCRAPLDQCRFEFGESGILVVQAPGDGTARVRHGHCSIVGGAERPQKRPFGDLRKNWTTFRDSRRRSGSATRKPIRWGRPTMPTIWSGSRPPAAT